MTIKQILFLSFFSILSLSCKNNQSGHHHSNEKMIYVSSDEGEKWNLLGVKITSKILSSQSNGTYSVIITETPPEGGPPLHVHSNEDELFYVLKGKYTFTCGEKKMKAKQGDFIRLPRGIPHRFVNTDTITGITMNTITPGGFEKFFSEMAEASKNGRPSKSVINTIANKYGVKFVKK
ncbi:Cupin domain-containing protein [Tenacibaculum sp. MAR_2009_124]|uniref:cupin domain-containing protein n=1 Tax=Tenacibaculum sp. MAR_2009_124 TaxID=1250059 RepID=UPI00089A41C6|nr:cupin domain-containing protein [Tenacibaculum sp. MAR_2009_124]SEB36726.1 Cupin domain-containing protein [Tenacibaculum sp. MAR_2009_124]